MAKGYRRVDRDQPFLLPPDMREWLPADHPVWLVIRVVEDHLDTSVFHARRRTGGAGAAGYDPDMLVMLLVWAYAQGVTSSRRIETACWSDVAFRVICAGDAPDHVTIARFRAAFPGAVESLFTGVLVLCARLGMGSLGTIALDGMKIAADASKAANRTEGTLRELAAQTVAAHARADAAEDARLGGGRHGGRVPPGGPPRDERIAAALAELQAEREAARAARDAQAQEYLAHQDAGLPGPPPAAARVRAAQARVQRASAACQAKVADWDRRAAARGRALPGIRPLPPDENARVRAARAALAQAEEGAAKAQRKAARKAAARAGNKGPVRNITDADSRLMPVRGGGFIQGYNAQNVASEDGLIIATELTQDTTDTQWFGPMLDAALDAAALITSSHPAAAGATQDPDSSGIGLALADAGYLSKDNLTVAGPDRLIATGKHCDLEKTARQATAGGGAASDGGTDDGDGPIAAMAARLATEEGITAYRKRGHIAETPHGNIKHNMGFRQLNVRGLPKASAEWRLTVTVHNLFKAISTGNLTHATLATLAT
jgi:transposase